MPEPLQPLAHPGFHIGRGLTVERIGQEPGRGIKIGFLGHDWFSKAGEGFR